MCQSGDTAGSYTDKRSGIGHAHVPDATGTAAFHQGPLVACAQPGTIANQTKRNQTKPNQTNE